MKRYLLLVLILVSVVLAGCTPGKSKADLADAALQRGLQAHAAGRLEEATAIYQEVLDLDPRNKFALYNLGLIDQTSGRPASAENYYRLVINLDPSFAPALFNLAILRTAAGSTAEAIELYRRVIALEPDQAGAHLNLGLLLRSIGQEVEGDREIDLALHGKRG